MADLKLQSRTLSTKVEQQKMLIIKQKDTITVADQETTNLKEQIERMKLS